MQFTASRPRQNAAKTTPAITKHCCQTCHPLQEMYSHHTYPQTTTRLPIEQRIIFKISMFVFKTIHGVSPTYLCSLVKLYEPLRGNMRSVNKLLLTEQKSKNSRGARLFTVSAAKACNTLPNNIRASATVGVFKTALKTHLSKPYFEWYMWTFPWTCSGLYTFYDTNYFLLLYWMVIILLLFFFWSKNVALLALILLF